MNFKKSLLALFITGISVSASASPLQQELRHLLKTHPLLKASDNELKAAAESLEAAEAAFYPKLTVDASYGREKISTQSYLPDANYSLGNNGVGNMQNSSLTANKIGATLKMPLYHGFDLRYQLKLEELSQSMASLNRDGLEQSLLLEGITSYLQVARFQLLIELTKINEASTNEQLELEKKRVERGGGIQVDELQAKTRLQIVKERRVFYQQGLRDALATYEQVFGKAPNLAAFQMLEISKRALPKNLQDAVAQGLQKNPDVLSSQFEIDKSKQSLNRSKAARLPKVDLIATKSRDNNKNALSRRNDEFIGIEMSWTFSLAGEFSHRESEAKSRVNVSEQQSQNVINKNKELVRISYNQVINGQERLDLLEDAANISKSVMMDRKKLRDAGKETALSALDAEVEYYGVLANKINAQIDTKIGAYRLLASMGALSKNDIGVLGEFKLPVKPLRDAIDNL